MPLTKSDKELLLRLDEQLKSQGKVLDQILQQAKLTNGRVGALETKPVIVNSEEVMKDLKVFGEWRNQIKGQWRLASVIAIALSSLISSLLTYFLI